MSNSVESEKLIRNAFLGACAMYSTGTIKGFRHFIDRFDKTLRNLGLAEAKGLAGAKLKLIIEFPNLPSQEPLQPPQVVEVELGKLIKEFFPNTKSDKINKE